MALQIRRFLNPRKSCSCSMPGVWRAVAYAAGFVTIFHSPKACAHVARTMDINSYYRAQADNSPEGWPTVPLLSSQLEERHAIFGGVEQLETCIAFAVAKYKPSCLVIANSCVAGVIGDDVGAVVREAEEKYQLPILTVDCYGFLDGEYYQGYYDTAAAIVKNLIKPAPKRPGTVILLGDNGGPWGNYAKEVTRLLTGLGLKVVGQFPGYVAYKELHKVASAEYSLVLGGRGKTHVGLVALANLLEERFNVKTTPALYPIGWQGLCTWLKAMGQLFGAQQQATALLAQEEKEYTKGLEKFLSVTKSRPVALVIGRYLEYFHPEAIVETMAALKLQVSFIMLLDAYEPQAYREMAEALQEACQRILGFLPPFYKQGQEEGLFEQVHLALTTHELKVPCKQLFLPMLPKVGLRGELDFMEAIYRALASRHGGGGISYV